MRSQNTSEKELERTKLAIETSLKRRDQALAQKQLELAQAQFVWQKEQIPRRGLGVLFSPTGVVIVGAALGLLGTAAGKWADYVVNKRQQETSIILKASDVPQSVSPELQDVQRARNLLWFAEARYIDLPEQFINQLHEASKLKPGQTLPPPVVINAPQAPLSAEILSVPHPYISDAAFELIVKYEGLKITAYQFDSSERRAIGYGHVLTKEELSSGQIKIGSELIPFANGISSSQAQTILRADLEPIHKAIDRFVKVPLNSDQVGSLTSFIYNEGTAKFVQSTLLKKLNQGKYEEIPEELLRWSKSNGTSGIPLPGLKLRRAAEAQLWNRGSTVQKPKNTDQNNH